MEKIFSFTLYQMSDKNRYKIFKDLPEKQKTINLIEDKYKPVYSAGIRGEDINNVLDKLFYIFNVEHPEDYKGRSMSISDIIKIEDKFYYVQSIGFKEIKVIE